MYYKRKILFTSPTPLDDEKTRHFFLPSVEHTLLNNSVVDAQKRSKRTKQTQLLLGIHLKTNWTAENG
jgi:hypothetical protein